MSWNIIAHSCFIKGLVMDRVNITKSFLPPFEEYISFVEKIYESGVLTNNGSYVQEFEHKMKTFLNVDQFHFLTNGTIALQLALSSLNINDGEIITTPFSYVATISSILWQRCTPIFADIEKDNFTLNPDTIEALITERTRAIMAVHVFGYACDVEKIQAIADTYNLKVIYDGAHAFGTRYKGKSLLSYGDVSTLSFHATKLFHTIEGGACIVRDNLVSDTLDLQKRFGHNWEEHVCLGINAKANEFQATMGLANFPYITNIIQEREECSKMYDIVLDNCMQRPKKQKDLEYNYAYYPIIFESEEQLLCVFEKLQDVNIFPRRYFYPSLNLLPYVQSTTCPVSEDISKRIACLPLYVGLQKYIVEIICNIIKENI